MKDSEGVEFLQWCLPKLHLCWPGFRKVRRQVYRRLDRRLKELQIPNIQSYRLYLESHGEEWSRLAGLCQITISRFYRDKGVFEFLEREGLPELAHQVLESQERTLRCWSIGCASGEEPYTLAILWVLGLTPQFPELQIEILGTDIDPILIERAKRACFPAGSLKDLPGSWVKQAFDSSEGEYRLKDDFQKLVRFRVEDIRKAVPESRFHVILCRYLAFTYFDEDSQREILQKIWETLLPEGMLVIGSTENLPQGQTGFRPWREQVKVFRKI